MFDIHDTMINDPARLVKSAFMLSVRLFFSVFLLSWPFTPALAHSVTSAD